METLFKYPFDSTGKSSTNRIIDEPHSIELGKRKVIIPKEGAFYTPGLILTRKDGRPLIKDIDYRFAHLYEEATCATGIEVCMAIVITNESLYGDFLLTYQVVGGEYSGLYSTIVESIENLKNADFRLRWEDILFKPTEFNPIDHCHDAKTDLTGLKTLVESVDRVTAAVLDVNAEKVRILESQLDDKVSAIGHTKIRTDDAQLVINGHVGPVELTFGRSNIQEGLISLCIQVIQTTGTSEYVITGEEIDNGFYVINYANTGIGSSDFKMLLHTRDGSKNHLILGDSDHVWDRSVLVVRSLVVSDSVKADYDAPWEWSTDVDMAGIDLEAASFPDADIADLTSELNTIHNNLRNVTDLVSDINDDVNNHVNDKNNPHAVVDEPRLQDKAVEIINQVYTEIDRGITF